MMKTFLLIFLSFLCYKQMFFRLGAETPINTVDNLKVDTIDGFFLYELNVPYSCYSRFDQVEQAALIIEYDSLLFDKDIKQEYKKGVFFYLYSKGVSKHIDLSKVKSVYNDSSVIAFLKKVNYMQHEEDSSFMRTVIFDKSKLLMYKKVYAQFVCIRMGAIDCLIPDVQNYRCCYANSAEKIEARYILDVLKFKVY